MSHLHNLYVLGHWVTGYAQFFNPRYSLYPVWSSIGTYTTTSFVIWGGGVWKSKGTVPGTATDDYTLSAANWTFQTLSNALYYTPAYDPIKYDLANDLIIERTEVATGNIVRFNKESIDYFTGLGITQNAIKDFQWGHPYVNATPAGVGQITVDEGYFKNLNSAALYQRNIQLRRKAYQNIAFGTSAAQSDIVFSEGSNQTNGVLNAVQSDIVIGRNYSFNRAAATISSNETSLTPGFVISSKIKLPAATLLATPVDSVLEYDGTHLYFTIGSTSTVIL